LRCGTVSGPCHPPLWHGPETVPQRGASVSNVGEPWGVSPRRSPPGAHAPRLAIPYPALLALLFLLLPFVLDLRDDILAVFLGERTHHEASPWGDVTG